LKSTGNLFAWLFVESQLVVVSILPFLELSRMGYRNRNKSSISESSSAATKQSVELNLRGLWNRVRFGKFNRASASHRLGKFLTVESVCGGLQGASNWGIIVKGLARMINNHPGYSIDAPEARYNQGK
jgi:hypothetical protein